jgi:hypothetical protein
MMSSESNISKCAFDKFRKNILNCLKFHYAVGLAEEFLNNILNCLNNIPRSSLKGSLKKINRKLKFVLFNLKKV